MIFGRSLVAAIFFTSLLNGQAKRLVLVKVDGLPEDRLERLVQEIDPETGRSALPWMHYIFIERGAWVQNFYVRGISLSAPSWSMLDTGQHMTIRGNAVDIPAAAWNDVYEAHLTTCNVFFDTSTGFIYVYMPSCGDDAGAYEIVWIFKNGRYVKRYVGGY